MAVTLDDFKKQINGDDDDFEDDETLQNMLDQASAFVNMYVEPEDGQYTGDRLDQYNKMVDRAVLEYATNLYVNRDGTAKNNIQALPTLGVLLNYIRNVPL